MKDVKTTASFATAPKDGLWYEIPCLAPDLSEFIRWDKMYQRWDWIMLLDDVALIEASHVLEKN
jgi:hypothetical protein